MIKPIEYVSVAERTHERLRSAILTGDFQQGERLDPQSLAAMAGVSLQPVKYALNRLQLEGLVEIRPRSGTFVRCIRITESIQLLRVRLMMETFAVGEATELDDQSDRIMAQALDDMARIIERQPFDWLAYNEHDMTFHRTVVALSTNDVLYRQYSGLNFHWATGRFWVNREVKTKRDHADHAQILKALRQRDWDKARAVITSHIMSSVRTLEELMQQQAPLTTPR